MSSLPSTRPLRVAIADDYEIITQGLSSMLAPYTDRVEVVRATIDGPESLGSTPVDVMLVDTFANPDPTATIRSWLASSKVAQVVVFTLDFEPSFVAWCLDQGVGAYLSKDTPASQLVEVLERVAAGELVVDAAPVDGPGPEADRHLDTDARRHWPGEEDGLSERESEVLSLVSEGLHNAEIATVLFISPETVKTHLSRIYRKLAVRNRSQAVAMTLQKPSFRRHRPG